MQGSQNPHAREDGHLRDGTGPCEPEGVKQQHHIQQHREGPFVGEDAQNVNKAFGTNIDKVQFKICYKRTCEWVSDLFWAK